MERALPAHTVVGANREGTQMNRTLVVGYDRSEAAQKGVADLAMLMHSLERAVKKEES